MTWSWRFTSCPHCGQRLFVWRRRVYIRHALWKCPKTKVR